MIGNRLCAGALLCLLTLPAQADTWISATVASYHPGGGDYNERNWGLGIEHGIAPTSRLVAGGYRNSFYKDSYYAGISWAPLGIGPVRLGVVTGIVTGYNDTVEPVILPMLTLEGKRFGANVAVMPAKDGGVTMFGLQLKVRWK